MTAKTDFQNKFRKTSGSQISANAGVLELAGDVHDALCPRIVLVTDNLTLTPQDTGKVFIVTADAKVITLPSTAAGLKYTIINGQVDGKIMTISPAAVDAIHGTTNASTNVVLSGVDNKDAINTAASATTGDNMTIVGDGVEGWYVIGCHGIWASQG